MLMLADLTCFSRMGFMWLQFSNLEIPSLIRQNEVLSFNTCAFFNISYFVDKLARDFLNASVG